METTESKKSTEKCNAKHPRTNEPICTRDIWDENEKLCIFHCKEKPVEEFRKLFLDELNRVNASDSIKEFDGRWFIFPPNIKLEEISFDKPVNFQYAQFGDEALFWETKFGNGADFGVAKFGDGANFWTPKFGDGVDFTVAKFGDRAHFGIAQFGDNANFESTQFGDGALFVGAQFGDGADFEGTKFGDRASFWSAKFGNRASFVAAKFGDGARFGFAQFGDGVDFMDAQFGHQLNFIYARFNGETNFKNIKFEERNSNYVHNFTNVIFERPNKVVIENVDLNSFAFVKTNVQEINFLDCDWPEIGNRLAVFDEIYYSKKNTDDKILKKATLGEIEQLYLRLQANFENNKRYAEAGDFYIGAMEMRRKQIAEKSGRIRKWLRQNIFSLIACYRLVSLYGERYTRSLIWMLAVLLLFPIFYLLAGFDYPETNPPSTNTTYENVNYDISFKLNTSQLTRDFSRALFISLHAFTFQRNAAFRLSTASQVVSIIESVLSAILIALFLLAIRRRFRR